MRAEELGVDVYDAKDITEERKDLILEQVLERLAQHEHIYLTLDMDVINAAHAPGVSSPQPFGLDPTLFLFFVKGILATGKVRSIDIAEVSPRYDADYQTAKLAAVVLYAIINTLCV
jgi:formiminoglutamase